MKNYLITYTSKIAVICGFVTGFLVVADSCKAVIIGDVGNHVSADITTDADGSSTYSNFVNNWPRSVANDAWDFHFSYGTGGQVVNIDWSAEANGVSPITSGAFGSESTLQGLLIRVPKQVPASEIQAYWTRKDHSAIPEPTTIIGSSVAIGFGILFKKEFSKKHKKQKV